MWRGNDRWPAYVPVAERRRKAEREAAKLRKQGSPMAPVRIDGRTIATTFWGRAWCDNLESYRDFDNRLPRGRTYVRNGSVIDLRIAEQQITALVSGSSIYKVKIEIKATTKTHWKALCLDCAGGIESLVELLQGRFSKAVMARLCRQDKGLFPRPSEISFSCSCPDWASMCKHVAATLYGVGARLDEKPELLFRLRGVKETELVANLEAPLAKQAPMAGKVIESDDLSALFGLEMATEDPAGAPTPAPAAFPARVKTKTKTKTKTKAKPVRAAEKAKAPGPGQMAPRSVERQRPARRKDALPPPKPAGRAGARAGGAGRRGSSAAGRSAGSKG